uniref:Chemokine interleukin-8-like domain-containing protein n=2 Tax=Sphaeramia orbicularis TaxID=375764 RepID=A0A673AKS5_9TELE
MVSVKAPVIVFVFFTICLLAANTSAAYRRCCHRYLSFKLPFEVIEGYSLQTVTEGCPIDAIIFHTKKGKHPCTNPALSWVMDYVNRLRTKAQRVHQNPSKA